MAASVPREKSYALAFESADNELVRRIAKRRFNCDLIDVC